MNRGGIGVQYIEPVQKNILQGFDLSNPKRTTVIPECSCRESRKKESLDLDAR
jgi:hypothetical protein